MILRLLAVLSFSAALWISADSGSCIDPYGGCNAATIDKGMGLDPNGGAANIGAGIDPNGYTGDGAGLDPHGGSRVSADGGPHMDPNG